jgi:DNA-binding CsgD family transcriptional regulator
MPFCISDIRQQHRSRTQEYTEHRNERANDTACSHRRHVGLLQWDTRRWDHCNDCDPECVVISIAARARALAATGCTSGNRLAPSPALSSGAALEDLTDAVFRPDGRTLESCVRVNDPVRERLRDFVQKRESERSGRAATRKIWSELVDGRWTLIDHFESDGRRVVIALRNMPVGESLCRLTAREIDALTQARNGASNKEIGLSMKLSASSVTRLLQIATRKLNTALADILQFPPADTIMCRELLLGDSSLSTISVDSIGEWRRALTDAENCVVSAVLRGHSNREIATMRGRSVRTVVNQLASAFEKLGVRSRREMVNRVSGLAMADVGEDRDSVSSACSTC